MEGRPATDSVYCHTINQVGRDVFDVGADAPGKEADVGSGYGGEPEPSNLDSRLDEFVLWYQRKVVGQWQVSEAEDDAS